VLALSENAVAGFSFPTPDALPPPLMSLDRVAVGYDGKPVLRGLDIRLDADDRIALLGANGEGKSTLSKLIAGRLKPLEGSMTTGAKLRVGFFAQHQLDELVPGESAFQHLARLRPDDLPVKLRSRLGAAGFGADIVDNPVELLSGGQKARLLMTMASIDAPHILILDEPTNHLDIESREALIQSLNSYEGTIILVSHDSHLVETVADQLWLVQDGRVETFSGDMEDYKQLLLSRRGAATGPSNAVTPVAQPGVKKLSPGREKRQATSHLRAQVKGCERAMKQLADEKARLEAVMAEPGFYDAGDPTNVQQTVSRLQAVTTELADAEMAWLEAEEALESALG
ncbi:MAG: ATP-binding cassette domain-containing protein, partial [Candidatus Puniceispirillum sp.]